MNVSSKKITVLSCIIRITSSFSFYFALTHSRIHSYSPTLNRAHKIDINTESRKKTMYVFMQGAVTPMVGHNSDDF